MNILHPAGNNSNVPLKLAGGKERISKMDAKNNKNESKNKQNQNGKDEKSDSANDSH